MVTFFGKLSCKFHTSINFLGRTRQSSELLYGIHPVLCALTFRHRDIYRLYVKDTLSNCKDPDNLVEISTFQITEKALKYGIPVTRVPVEKLKELSNSRAHQGVILEVSPTTIQSISDLSIKNLLFSWNNLSGNLPYAKKYHRPTVLLLDHMMDTMNFGNILRSAAFFGISAVILSTSPCVSPSPLISKISVGAMESILFYRLTDTVMDMKSLSNAGFLIVGTCGESQLPSSKVSKSTDLLKPDEVGANNDNTGVYPRPLILALGSESRGLSENVLNSCDLLLRIPGYGDSTKLNQCISQTIPSSLNVSVAAGILLYQLTMFRHGHEAANKSSFISHTE
ncbi:putative rrna methylase [Schistosoma mansoni]|uniref:rRNA methyltransferase 1, mitochondrial n=1 Tax=Schistosoma mansoni TaxID=6183 RepID=G4VGN4_SCHMA|nr:putative rrna methylase [Schistosoma mansoni]|eukprot:XP_018650771.1 putative rrna methylase [Schistosoma mansoni]